MPSACYVIKGGEGKMRLTNGQKFAYGVGHVFNDLCASMWFTYLLIFFNKVIQFSSSLAGTVLLVGQIADGVATPFIGYLSDRGDNMWLCKYGKRKTWHFVGTLAVIFSFPFIFSPCIGCETSETWIQMTYYSIFVVIFQIGWASVQICHLALVPELTPDEHERTSLLAIRNSFTVISSIVVYGLLWVVLEVDGEDPSDPITPKDLFNFQIVTYSVLALGIVMSLIFIIGTREGAQESLLPHEESRQARVSGSTLSLFTKLRLYQVALLYMGTRLFANISQIMFPLYLHDDLKLGGRSIAVLPLVMYILSFFMSILTKTLNKRCGRKMAFCFGAAVGVGVSVWVRFADSEMYRTYLIYAVAGLYGISSSALLVTSLGITADLIGQDLNNGAFIYGIMSFCDKVSNGVVVMAIQSWSSENHYRDSLAYVCGGSALLGAMAVLTLCNMPSEVTDEPVYDHEQEPEQQKSRSGTEVAT